MSPNQIGVQNTYILFVRVLKVCKDATTPQGRFALDELRLDEINDAILYNDVEDPAQGRLLHLLLNEVHILL